MLCEESVNLGITESPNSNMYLTRVRNAIKKINHEKEYFTVFATNSLNNLLHLALYHFCWLYGDVVFQTLKIIPVKPSRDIARYVPTIIIYVYILVIGLVSIIIVKSYEINNYFFFKIEQ